MKATEATKKSVTLEQIDNNIKSAIENNHFKVFYPHFIYVSDEVKLSLIKNGFKVYEGTWMYSDMGLIIEW